MACIITYNNKKYTQPEFNEYFKSHFFEFAGDFLGSKQDIEGFKNWVNNRNNFDNEITPAIDTRATNEQSRYFDKELVQKAQDKLQKLYPEIKFTNNPVWEKGKDILNQIIENEMGEDYWKNLYTQKNISNREEFESVKIPTIKNKFKPDFENVYHGTNTYEIDNEGNLILTPSKNFDDKTTSISFTQIPAVAQDYMLRKNGNIIIKINNEALGSDYDIESAEEIAVNGNQLFIVPKGQYEIITVPTLAEKMRKKYANEVEIRAEELKNNAKSDLHLIDAIYSERIAADNYSELQEYSDVDISEQAPEWYVPDEYLDSRAAKKVYEGVKSKINKKWVIDTLSNVLIEQIKNTGDYIASIESALNDISTYGGRHAPHQSTLFEELLSEIGLGYSQRSTYLTEGDKLEKAKQKQKEYNDILDSIESLVEKQAEESVKYFNFPEQVKLREEQKERDRLNREITQNLTGAIDDDLPFQKVGDVIIGQANIKAMSVMFDPQFEKKDGETRYHEYAHHYIAWFRNHPLVQEAIKKWGSEEGLVQAIGEQSVKQKGEAWTWWKKFFNFLQDLIGKLPSKTKEELRDILTDAFLSRVDLDTGNIGMSSERIKKLAQNASNSANVSDSHVELKEDTQKPVKIDTTPTINIYSGDLNGFETLSNFSPRVVNLPNGIFPTVEHAYQYAKAVFAEDVAAQQAILKSANAKEPGRAAQALGKVKWSSIQRIADWDAIKVEILSDIMRSSFQQNPEAMALLKSTGKAKLTHYSIDKKGNKTGLNLKNWEKDFPAILESIRDNEEVPLPSIEEMVDTPFSIEEVVPWETEEFKNNKPSIGTEFINPVATGLATLENYGFDKSLSGSENLRNMLETVKLHSDNPLFSALANLLQAIDKRFGTLDRIELRIGDNNRYQSGVVTLNPSIGLDESNFQYIFLHELVHAFTVDKLKDGSEESTFIRNRINRFIAYLEPNLVDYATKYLGEEEASKLPELLKTLRAATTQDSSPEMPSAVALSLVNGLKDEFEFLSHILNDGIFQDFANSYTLPEEDRTISEMLLDMVKAVFNNFKKALGFDITKGSVLDQGLNAALRVLQNFESDVAAKDKYVYWGAEYEISVDSQGRAVDVNLKRSKSETATSYNNRKQKIIDAYNDNPNVDIGTGKAFRQPVAISPIVDLKTDPNANYIIKVRADGVPLYANDEQRVAIDAAVGHLLQPATGKLGNDSFLILGAGGTGKTASVFTAIENFLEKSKRSISDVVFSAPTHNATKELRRAINDPEVAKNNVRTLASLLGTILRFDEQTGAEVFEPIPIEQIQEAYDKFGILPEIFRADFIVIDEVSMLGANVATLIEQRLQERKIFTSSIPKFLFMGDYRQIPPIDPDREGNDVDKDGPFINLRIVPDKYVKLTKVMRTDNSDILSVLKIYSDNIDEANKKIDAGLDLFERKGVKPNFRRVVPFNPNLFRTRKDSVNVRYETDPYAFVKAFAKAFKEDPLNVLQAVVVNYNAYSRPETQSMIRGIRQELFGEASSNIYNKGELLLSPSSNGVMKFDDLEIYPNDRLIVKDIKKIKIKKYFESFGKTYNLDEDGYELTLVNEDGKEVIIEVLNRAFMDKFNKNSYDVKKKGYTIDGKFIHYSLYKQMVEKKLFNKFDYGYVVNSHKVQGSSYNHVFVHEGNILAQERWMDAKSMNQILYTAMSRTRHKLYILNSANPKQVNTPFQDTVVGQIHSFPPIKAGLKLGVKKVKSIIGGVISRNVSTQVDKKTPLLEKVKVVKHLNNQRAILYQKKTAVYKNKTLTDAEKNGKAEKVQAEIDNLELQINDAVKNWSIQALIDISESSFYAVDKLLEKPTFDEYDLLSAIETVQTFKNLVHQVQNNYGDQIDQTLYDAVEEAKYAAAELDKKILDGTNPGNPTNGAKVVTQAFIRDKTGKNWSLDELFSKQMDSNWFESTVLGGYKSRVVITGAISAILEKATEQIKEARNKAKSIEDKELDDFLKKFKFEDIVRTEEKEDIDGIKRVKTQYRTRYLDTYYYKRSKIFKDANKVLSNLAKITPADMEKKKTSIKNALEKLEFVVDIRYLFWGDYNTLKGEDRLDKTHAKQYREDLEAIIRQQFGDLGSVYMEKRFEEILQQAINKYEDYKNSEIAYRLQLEAEGFSVNEIKANMNDFHARNNPMLWLDEYKPLKAGNKIYYGDTPILSMPSLDGKKQYVRDGSFNSEGYYIKERKADTHLVIKPLRFNDKRVNLGLYDEDFLKWEKEDYNNPSELTLYKFLNWAIDTENHYAKMFPAYLRANRMYFHMTDITKDVEDIVNEASILGKMRLLPSLVWSKYVVKKLSKRSMQENYNTIDGVSGEIKRNIKSLSYGKLNSAGVGDTRLMDARKYFDIIRDTALYYENMSQLETNIRIAQYIYNNTDNQGIKYAEWESTKMKEDQEGVIQRSKLGTDKKAFDFVIDKLMYQTAKPSSGSTRSSGKRYQLTYTELEEIKKLKEEKEHLDKNLERLNNYKNLIYADKLLLLKEMKFYSGSFRPTPTWVGRQGVAIKDRIEATEEKIKNLSTKIASLETARELSGGKFLDAIRSGISTIMLSFNPTGRFTDFGVSGILNTIEEGVDGRIYKVRDFAKAFMYVMPCYGFNNLAEITAVAAVFTHQWWLAALLLGVTRRVKGQTITGAIYNTIGQAVYQEKKEKKLVQLLNRFGAFESARNVSDSGLVLTGKESFKFLNPSNLLQRIEEVNRGLVTMSALYGQKVTNLAGEEKSVVDAFTLDAQDNLIWNEREFGPEPDLHDVQSKITGVVNSTQGNYSRSTPTPMDDDSVLQLAFLFRKYMPEAVDNRFAGFKTLKPKYNHLTGQYYIGTYAAAVAVPRGKFDRSNPIYRRAGAKLAFNTISTAIGTYLSMVFYHFLKTRASGPPDQPRDTDTLNLIYLYNIISRVEGEQASWYNTYISIRNTQWQSAHPVLKVGIQAGKVFDDAHRAYIGRKNGFTWEESDLLSAREVSSRNMSPYQKVWNSSTKMWDLEDIPLYSMDYPDPRALEKWSEQAESNQYVPNLPPKQKHFMISRWKTDVKTLLPWFHAQASVLNTTEDAFPPPINP